MEIGKKLKHLRKRDRFRKKIGKEPKQSDYEQTRSIEKRIKPKQLFSRRSVSDDRKTKRFLKKEKDLKVRCKEQQRWEKLLTRKIRVAWNTGSLLKKKIRYLSEIFVHFCPTRNKPILQNPFFNADNQSVLIFDRDTIYSINFLWNLIGEYSSSAFFHCGHIDLVRLG